MTEIETLQAIVADETRSAEERKAAAEHVLALQGQPQPTTPTPQSMTGATGKQRFTTTELNDLARLKSVMAELTRESEEYNAAAKQQQ